MAQAIAAGVLVKNPDLQLDYYDILNPFQEAEPATEALNQMNSPEELEEHSDIILLCIKPQDMKQALKSLKGNKKYISIAAGLSLDRIQGYFQQGHSVTISRVMPNISATVGKAVSGIYCEDMDLRQLTFAIFSDVGFAVEVSNESLLHAVTGLSGSGPAFVFAFIQALSEGGVLCGLPYDTSLKLATHMVKGAAEMLIEKGEHPGTLRNQVTSPGGTTISGLLAMEEGAFNGTVMQAVEAATRRSQELE